MSSRNTSTASLRGCCCFLFLLLSFLLLLSFAILLIIVLAIKPKKPQLDLQQVIVQNLNFSPTDQSNISPVLSVTVHMFFIAKNDNIAGIEYKATTFEIIYRGVPLGRGTVPAFFQGAHSKKNVRVSVYIDRMSLLQTDSDEMVQDIAVNDRVEFRVMGDVNAKIRIIGITSPNVQVSIDCAIVISPSTQSLVSKKCGFDGLQV
ncbi:NDR1/HIN1-like protein 13 [Tanacetum coccineum]